MHTLSVTNGSLTELKTHTQEENHDGTASQANHLGLVRSCISDETLQLILYLMILNYILDIYSYATDKRTSHFPSKKPFLTTKVNHFRKHNCSKCKEQGPWVPSPNGYVYTQVLDNVEKEVEERL